MPLPRHRQALLVARHFCLMPYDVLAWPLGVVEAVLAVAAPAPSSAQGPR